MEQLSKEADALVMRHQTSQRDIEQLRADLAKHQAESSDLKAQLTQVKQENAGLCGCLRDGEQKFESLQCKIQMAEVMHGSLRDKVKDLASCGNQAEHYRIALEESFDRRFKSYEDMMCTITTINNEHKKLTNHIADLRAALESATVKETELQEQLEERQAELNKKESTLRDLRLEQDALLLKLDQKSNEFKAQLVGLEAHLKQKEAELHENADRLSKLQADSEARNSQLSTDLQAAQHSIEVLQAKAEAAAQLHEVDEREKTAALGEAERLQQLVAEAQGQARDLEARLLEEQDACKSQVAELGDQKCTLEAELSTLKADLAELTSNLEERSAALHKTQEQAAEAIANAERMQKQVADATAFAEEERKRSEIAANKKIDEYKEHINQKFVEIKTDGEKKVAALQQQVQVFHTDVSAKVKHALNASEQEWASKLAALEAHHQSAIKALQETNTAEKEQLQKELSESGNLAVARLKSLEDAQAAAALRDETLGEKIKALTADLEAAKTAHEQEVARIKSDAEKAREEALAEQQKKHEGQLAKAITDLASHQDSLDAATTKIADLQLNTENMFKELQKGHEHVQHLDGLLAQTQEVLAEKEQRLAIIGQQATSASPSNKKRTSPPGSQKKHSPPAVEEQQVFEEQQELDSEEEKPQPKRRGRAMPSRFHQTHGKTVMRHTHQQPQYESGDDSQEDDASSDGMQPQVHRRRSEAVAARCVFTEPPMMASQRHEGVSAGRKTVFATMSASMHTDLEDGADVRPTSRRRRTGASEARRGGGLTMGASLLKHKAATDKKRKAARGGPPGSKRGPSSAMNLFGNTDPYAFAPSPV